MSTGLAVVVGLLAGVAIGASVVWAMLARRLAGITTERDGHARRSLEMQAERDTARADADLQRDAASQLREQMASINAEHNTRVEEMNKQLAVLDTRFKQIASDVNATTRSNCTVAATPRRCPMRPSSS